MKLSVILLSLIVATPAFANYTPCPPDPTPPPVETPVEPTPIPTPLPTPTPVTEPIESDNDPHISITPQYWTGTCKLTEDGKVLVHTAASFLKLFNPEKAMKLAADQCIERLKAKQILPRML